MWVRTATGVDCVMCCVVAQHYALRCTGTQRAIFLFNVKSCYDLSLNEVFTKSCLLGISIWKTKIWQIIPGPQDLLGTVSLPASRTLKSRHWVDFATRFDCCMIH